MSQVPLPLVHVGATKEIWDAINVDLQQIVDDVSCWEGSRAERVCRQLGYAVDRLNAAVGREREGYETAIAVGYENDVLRDQVSKLTLERDEADRRAGAAERRYAADSESLYRLNHARDNMKVAAGFERNVSFDDVWSSVLADALRYRWLRDEDNQVLEDSICVSNDSFTTYFGADLDAAVDAAKAAG